MDGVRSALVCVIDDPDPAVERLRRDHDPHAALGVPAHVTCVVPFVPPPLITADVIETLHGITAGFDAFTVGFPDVGEFPGVVWLRPEPDGPLRALTRALVAAFPEYPPYEGAFDDPQPHLTVGMDLDPVETATLRARVDSEVTPHLPFHTTVAALSLLTLDDAGRWHEELRLPLRGTGPGPSPTSGG